MTRNKGRRARLGMTWFAVALGALALLAMPSLAGAKDRNHDRIPDKWEKKHHLSLKVNQARLDQDRDHLRNRAEFLAGFNPRDKDSNDDGVMDDDENAGTIASFDAESGKLTIDLFGGETISGLVTEGTEIECDDNGGASVSSSGPGSGGEGGEIEPGDDEGGEGEVEPDDDNGGEEAPDNSGPGSENSGPGNANDDDEEGNCTTAALVPGAVVHEAELKVANGQATFEKVELSGKEA
jgi:hypothetical protein